MNITSAAIASCHSLKPGTPFEMPHYHGENCAKPHAYFMTFSLP